MLDQRGGFRFLGKDLFQRSLNMKTSQFELEEPKHELKQAQSKISSLVPICVINITTNINRSIKKLVCKPMCHKTKNKKNCQGCYVTSMYRCGISIKAILRLRMSLCTSVYFTSGEQNEIISSKSTTPYGG